jgi:predicted nucleic acid-binding Zn ribbon protein
MTGTGHPDDIPVRYGSRYGSRAPADARPDRSCPVCRAAITSARARYCSDACKQRAYRQRQTDDMPVDLDVLTADLRSRRVLVAHTVYECPTCEARFLGTQRCPDCHVFCRRLGLSGPCPHCDEPVTLAELLDLEEVQP